MCMLLAEMEERAQKRQAESDTNQLKLLAEMQQETRQQEQRHEEHMMGMMMSFLQQTMAMATGRYGPHYSAGPGIPPPPTPPPMANPSYASQPPSAAVPSLNISTELYPPHSSP